MYSPLLSSQMNWSTLEDHSLKYSLGDIKKETVFKF